MPRKPLHTEGPDVLTIKQTAALLGVAEVTLRRWDKCGKFSPHRHPVNGYRCYRREEVLRLRRQIRIGEGRVMPEDRSAAHANEPVGDTQRMLARQEQLWTALRLGLDHGEGSTASGVVVGSAAAIVEDAIGAQALRMLQDAMTALVNRSPREVEAVRFWHALRDGYDPNRDAIAIADLARLAARTAQMYRSSGTEVPTGALAIADFRAELVGCFGQRVPSAEQLEAWFAKLGKPRAKGGITLTGVVAQVIQAAQLFGVRGSNLSKTRKRVDRILARLPNPRELRTALPIPPPLLSD